MLRDRFEFEYQSNHLYYVTLDYVFHSISLSCFLPRAFVFLSWFDTSIHFVDTYLILQDMFIDHDHLILALYTYHELDTSFFVWSLIQFSTRCSYFHYGKVKGTFSHPYFFESCLDHLTIFSLMELESKFELKIYVYWWSTDLVIVCLEICIIMSL